jgi:hypothetical protein
MAAPRTLPWGRVCPAPDPASAGPILPLTLPRRVVQSTPLDTSRWAGRPGVRLPAYPPTRRFSNAFSGIMIQQLPTFPTPRHDF